MKKIIKIFSFFCYIPFIWGLAFAQTDFGYLEEGGGPLFFVDYASFREETGEKYRLEVYYKIFNCGLTFVKDDNRFKASYEIELLVLNKINKQVTGTSTEEDYVVDTYEETQSAGDFLINTINSSLYSGRYKLRMKFIDLNSASESVLEKNFTIPSRSKKKLMFSDIEFIKELSDSTGKSKFNKREKRVIPSVDRNFGDPDPTLRIYYEIYGGPKEPKEYDLIYEIYTPTHSFSRQETTKVQIGPETFYRFESFPLEGFLEGDYILSIKLLDKRKEKAKMERPFQVEWSLLSLLRNDYQKFVDQLRYAGTNDELKELREANVEERLQKWLEFWKSRDPTPNTPENELRDEYYRRLKYANQNFAISNREGWETDMGMVYIVYGHPDEVEKHPFERDLKAYQWWRYYKLNRHFLFVDRGDGEYELQPPYDGMIRR
ncbi:MAG: GWxTD domain-containing protein [candidate division Zixibacteria bacterium]|nr:GWxTD domain-containing protein [candidate division Zixibacteria bacterium]